MSTFPSPSKQAKTMRYSFYDYVSGKPWPRGLKMVELGHRARWTEGQVDEMLRLALPGKSAGNRQAQWRDVEMRCNGWRVLPYCFGYEDDGRAIVFDREYRPICEIETSGYVRVLQMVNSGRRAGDKIFIYHDLTRPHESCTSRVLIERIVKRLGLAGELLRRATLERAGVLPPSGHGRFNDPEFAHPWGDQLARSLLNAGLFGFDVEAGETLRLRPKRGAATGFEPRPLDASDIDGAARWLKCKGHEANTRDVAAVIDIAAALRPVINTRIP
ncbi:hypothetical protein DTW90_11785 [Neorhizobium sp. P12A]|uniref:hypothetical protein n=1 Tax=Neorhizobium sp. P12A TaxID=2268027 RepID=UPI0011EF0468|nr:hypothetical protein [Neorhizobium sp. P12A]KAA0699977.1 hypothetical protein DTW90_11785 [Neorhizobium sp. P12A]